MKIIHDLDILNMERGSCWINNSTLHGYGTGYPAVAELCRFLAPREYVASCRVGHILRNTIYDKYYQRRIRQLGMLSIFYIKTGEMYFRSNEQIILAEAGDCVLLKPHSKNEFLYLPGREPCLNYELALSGALLDDIIRLYGLEHVVGFHLDADDFFEDIFNRLKELKQRKSKSVSTHYLAGIAAETLSFIAQAISQKEVQQTARLVQDLLEQNIEKKIKMQDIAKMLDVSLPKMNKQFKLTFGITPYLYLKNARLQRGAELLRKGYFVKEVAALIGYSSPKSFAAEFHRFHGISPRQYSKFPELYVYPDESQEV
ncbi:MAG: helix-turn-helix transcriptional regulator [Victivallales bacterium]|nr:helix-turn-helix transcriptional regulator [Victivallales bacterium]